ncbi:hypothetical protein [Candidatus Vampirococcus lugosii]|uniref:Uncharacterized protein n=1 Tax=Candidatus Vampirococcus lugosii TaxID=2789015 RepID=A0ABS5QLN6_9BACT|nr:hypothetical protein [Candidatus Vampirococcus lugosii]MBS8121977.1 hypothetical protein [Candidatus Vampirococcus lugosii]
MNKNYSDHICDKDTFEHILSSKNSFVLRKNIFQNKEMISSNFEYFFESLGNLDLENKNKSKIISTIYKDKEIPNNIFYGYFADKFFGNIKDFNKISFELKDYNSEVNLIKDNNVIHYIKSFLIKYNNYSFKYIWEPFFISFLVKELKIEVDNITWKKIKFFMLFLVAQNYNQYIYFFEFFNKLETFKRGKTFDLLKIWGFWFITFPIFLLIFSIFLPLGVFISFLLLIFGFIYKIVKDIHSKTVYKVNFDIGFNILASFSFFAFLGGSFFLTNFDAYKSGYEKFNEFINLMTAVNTADVLGGVSNKADSISGMPDKETDLFDKVGHNYLYNKTYYEYNNINHSENIQDTQDIETDKSSVCEKLNSDEKKHSVSEEIFEEKKDIFYFQGKEEKISKGVYIYNLLEKIYIKHNLNKKINLNKSQKHFLFQEILKDYVLLNLNYFRENSISKNSWSMNYLDLPNYMPDGFVINMGELEKIFLSKLN